MTDIWQAIRCQYRAYTMLIRWEKQFKYKNKKIIGSMCILNKKDYPLTEALTILKGLIADNHLFYSGSFYF